MLSYIKGRVEVVCDNCESEFFEADTVEDAVDYMYDHNWDNYFDEDENEWKHICPKCQGREEDDDFDTSLW